ncbi:MAG: TlyA family RNA methyltransferase [Anaerolineales bacterium]
MAKNKLRIDQLLVERGLAESRTRAQRLVMAGQVRVAGEIVHKPSAAVASDAILEVEGGPRFVSRAGEKLEAGLKAFQILPQARICADVGSSTGGFTDCLLQQGAQRVYAIDVGKGQLHWKLRQDARVVVLENTNARYLEELPESVSLITVDVSFISALRILTQAVQWLNADGEIVVLIKPQFEAGPEQVGKGGIVSDPEVHREVLGTLTEGASELGLYAHGLIRSPVLGAKGNQEYLAWLRRTEGGVPIEELIESIFSSNAGSLT